MQRLSDARVVRFVRWALALWALVWLFVARTASAHAASDTYLTLAFPSVARGVTLDGRLDMPLADIEALPPELRLLMLRAHQQALRIKQLDSLPVSA